MTQQIEYCCRCEKQMTEFKSGDTTGYFLKVHRISPENGKLGGRWTLEVSSRIPDSEKGYKPNYKSINLSAHTSFCGMKCLNSFWLESFAAMQREFQPIMNNHESLALSNELMELLAPVCKE